MVARLAGVRFQSRKEAGNAVAEMYESCASDVANRKNQMNVEAEGMSRV